MEAIFNMRVHKHRQAHRQAFAQRLVFALISCTTVIQSNDGFAADIRPSGSAVTTQSPLDKARAAIARKDWQVAIRDLQGLVRAEPLNADAHNLLAFSLRNNGDLVTSKVHYDEALKLDPNHKGAHEYIGELYLKMKQPENAQKHLAILERLCGNKDCEEYRDLAEAMMQYKQ